MKPLSQKSTKEQPMIGWSREMVLDADHEFYRMDSFLDWAALEAEFGKLYSPNNGRPCIPIRLMAGLHFLKRTFPQNVAGS